MKAPAVYRLEHLPSGHVYVGGTANWPVRRDHWFKVLAASEGREVYDRPPGIGLRMFAVARLTCPTEWEFIIHQRFEPGCSGDDVERAERAYHAEIRALAGPLCLNSYNGFRPRYNPRGTLLWSDHADRPGDAVANPSAFSSYLR